MRIMTFPGLLALLATAACSTSPIEADYGNSVRSLRSAQAADPAATTTPSAAPVIGVEPDYASNVLKALREAVSKPEEVKQGIRIAVSGRSN